MQPYRSLDGRNLICGLCEFSCRNFWPSISNAFSAKQWSRETGALVIVPCSASFQFSFCKMANGGDGEQEMQEIGVENQAPEANPPEDEAEDMEVEADRNEAPVTPGPSHGREARGPRFSVTKWKAEASWRWDVTDDTCAICRNQLVLKCNLCQAYGANNQRCLVSIGACQHAYHTHCIAQWLKNRNTCPICNSPWAYDLVRSERNED